MYSKEYIVSEIRRTAEQKGGTPLGQKRFVTETGIRIGDWRGRYWARWSDALVEAGFEPKQPTARLDDDAVLAKLIPEIRRLGRLPTRSERQLLHREDESFPSEKVFPRFGSKQALASAVADYCKDRPECRDVLDVLQPTLDAKDASPGGPTGLETVPEDGFVYLLRSGRHYKLGRTNAFGRRERELAIQLPERASKVHVIKTDDPVGIEAYWHRRFADRRKGGEWFELTSADVKAFKRRKFM